jgi:hypothetical protein
MSRHLFGWSYPPGAATDPNAPYNQQEYEPSPESEKAAETLDEMHQGVCELSKGEDAIIRIIDDLADERDRLKELLQSTLSYLPARGEPPQCTCPPTLPPEANIGWCDRHDGGWDELTLKEEIENFLRASKDNAKP